MIAEGVGIRRRL
jgi:hypothetical protein